MKKTILVSNRLPFEVKSADGSPEIVPSVGGLATGLKSIHESGDSIWIGWTGLPADKTYPDIESAVARESITRHCVPVPLTARDIEDVYLGFSNNAIWPLFHYFLQYTRYYPGQWQRYVEVNRKFADEVLRHASPDDVVWVHDYQLLLVPAMLREIMPSLTIGLFLHIPFPAFEIFRTFPWRNELLEGMLGADLIGFHTYDYVQHFLNSVRRITGFETRFSEIVLRGRKVRTDCFPMGIDYARFHGAALEHSSRPPEARSEIWRRLHEHLDQYPDRKLILSIDRMDYTKGIPERLRAFEYFLDHYPQFREKVRLVMLVVPSRTNVPQYQKLKRETDELVGRINGKFATVEWTPVWYFYRSMPFEDLIDLYTSTHVALISPLRDGMNLVAKEYVATRTDASGVLILSEMAGAASEMNEALLINPGNIEHFADTLRTALEMPLGEQVTRFSALRKRLARYDVNRWADDFMNSLTTKPKEMESATCRPLDVPAISAIRKAYADADSRILMLDYDGTLVNFTLNPDRAVPDPELLEIIGNLAADPANEVAIVSGRGQAFLEHWFGPPVTLVSDHGVRMRRGSWEEIERVDTSWKESVRPVIENFVDRTPGAFIEEKEYSIAFHFRRCEAELAEIRTRELRIVLTALIADDALTILDGHKVLEVKSSLISKGRAATRLLSGKPRGFILAIGDDRTDEHMFDALPEGSFSIKVGMAETCAGYFVSDTSQIRKLLRELSSLSKVMAR